MINQLPSSKAHDRQISEWFNKIEEGHIKLPLFQRHEAWDKKRIASLLETVVRNLPLGITLILNVDEEKFTSRYLVTAPQTGKRVTEHLLDGQQRLTSLWRALHNNYDDTKYFLYLKEYDRNDDGNPDVNDIGIEAQSRWNNKNGDLFPRWADSPEKSLNRGLIPLDLIFPSSDRAKLAEEWVKTAMEKEGPDMSGTPDVALLMEWMQRQNDLKDTITAVSSIVKNFNLPFLSLPSATSKMVALDVFINMNTNSKPLSQYDIIRAQVVGANKNTSLDDLQQQLEDQIPDLASYWDITRIILNTSSLLQGKEPNQKGAWEMDVAKMVDNWPLLTSSLKQMVDFLTKEGVYDNKRLPTIAPLPVIAALFAEIPKQPDAQGNFFRLIRKYLWTAFFTERYDRALATYSYADYQILIKVVRNLSSSAAIELEDRVPIFNRDRHPLATQEQIEQAGWPVKRDTLSRGIMAVFTNLGAKDFADGSVLDRSQLALSKRHYHHIFPRENLERYEVNPNLAINCALISGATNQTISNKETYRYLADRYKWTDEEVINERLSTHLILARDLQTGGYEEMTEIKKAEKTAQDFKHFISSRSVLVHKAVRYLANGKEITALQLINETP